MPARRVSDEQILQAYAKARRDGLSIKDLSERLGYANSSPLNDRLRCLRRDGHKLPSLAPHGGALPTDSQARELRELREEVKRLRKESADTTALKALIRDASTRQVSPPDWLHRHRKTPSKWHHGTPTLFLSDLHWGERVFANQVNGVNEYGLAIARKRLRRVLDTARTLLLDVLSSPSYDGIVLALGGDMVSGNIHEELRETNEAPILDVVMDLLEHISAVIRALADSFGKVFVPCVVGNHGRMDKKPRAKGAIHDNFEWILYQLLAKEFAGDPRVTVLVSDSLDVIYRIHGTRYLLTHGDQFRGGSGISGPLTPWSLGDARKRKRQQAIAQPYDCMIFGHWHSLTWGPGDSWIVNGSLKGYDEFAFRSNFGFEAPQQALWVTHPHHGITFRMGVQADDVQKPEATQWVSVGKAA